MKKRLLSLAIAICMVAAMLPAVAAADFVSAPALKVNESISYYFCAHATNSDIPAKGAINTYAVNYNETTGRYWKYLGASTGNAKKSPVMTGRINGDTRNVNQFIALNIYVPEDGIYETEYYYYKIYNNGSIQGGKGDVYILPEGTEIPTSNNATIKSEDVTTKYNGINIASGVDYSAKDESAEKNPPEPVVAKGIDLKKGDNILLFVVTGHGDYVDTEDSNSNIDHHTYPTSLTLTLTEKAPAEDEALTNAFKPDDSDATVYAPSVDAVTTVTGTSAAKQADGSYKMVAPETDGSGNEFLYWAKGLSLNKRIVSLEREFTYTPAGGERNYLIPVYAPESATGNEYYNANGQLIDCATEAPALPSMAGYGKASGWAQYEDTNIYVAEYDNKTQPEDVKVTVNGTEKTVPYGTDITCIADDKDADNKPFKCWTKSNINGKEEIVSCDKNYTFKAWEDCSVTAVYEEHIYTGAKMKIIIDSFTVGSETGIMAEFIGLDSAVEKGIMFGTQKIAMTKPGAQFTVTADESGTYKGYAIVEDGEGGYTLITDGSVTISDME